MATAIAVPNFTKMVQNNRIKTTTNHIVGSLQFARQTASIEQTQVTACSPVPGNPDSCALANNWKNGVALLKGNAKVDKYTPPPPPTPPSPTAGPVEPSHPGYPAEPSHPGYPDAPKHPGYSSVPKPSPNPPSKGTPPTKRVVPYPKYPELLPYPPYPSKPSGGSIFKAVVWDDWEYLYTDSTANPDPSRRYAASYKMSCKVIVNGSTIYSDSSIERTLISSPSGRGSIPPAYNLKKRCQDKADEYNKNPPKDVAYEKALANYYEQKSAYDEIDRINKGRINSYNSALQNYPNRVATANAEYQKELEAYELDYQNRLALWQQQKITYQNFKTQVDQNHSIKMNEHAQKKSHIDSVYQQTIANWKQTKINIDNTHQQNINNWHQQVADHQSSWQKQLADHAAAMDKYNNDRSKDPSLVVSLEEAKTLLAHNPFAVTVTSQLNGGVTAVIYNKDRIKNGQGQIHIEDSRGRGEYSRTICINMFGNIKVIKGNESCP